MSDQATANENNGPEEPGGGRSLFRYCFESFRFVEGGEMSFTTAPDGITGEVRWSGDP